MATITVKLKQHTPMIHFQVGRDNISLRASDFKPRFDKYLLTLAKYYNENELSACKLGIQRLHKNINTKEREKSLYSARFGPLINCEKKNIPSRTLYFGDIKEAIMSEGIELTIETFDGSVKNCVLQGLPIFFALENFGTRQNKGFGCFAIQDIKVNNGHHSFESCEAVYKRIKTTDVYSFESSGSVRDLFNNIKNFYSTLKGGINFKDSQDNKYYSKSMLLKYFRKTNANLAWEKLLMKMHLKGEPLDTDNKHFVRGVLGLSDSYTFRPKNNLRVDPCLYKEKTVDIDSEKHFKITHVNGSTEKIVRAPSPLYFKPIIKDDSSFTVYILLKEELYTDENQTDIRKEKFKFSEGENDVFVLGLDKDFDLGKFMEFAKREFDTPNNNNLTSLVSSIKLTKVNNQPVVGEL